MHRGETEVLQYLSRSCQGVVKSLTHMAFFDLLQLNRQRFSAARRRQTTAETGDIRARYWLNCPHRDSEPAAP